MVTPLYKKLKDNGTTFYSLVGAAEDLQNAYNNANYRVSFSKFTLLNLPKQNVVAGTANNPVYFDFYNTFQTAALTQAPTFAEQAVESLRNYVANYEVTLKESKINTNEYFYNNNILQTPTEHIFYKWLQKLNVIDFEPAVGGDEYFTNLPEFERNNLNDDEYLQEYLWKERETIDWRSKYYYQTGSTYSNKLEVEYDGTTNLFTGDIVKFSSITNSSLTYLNGLNLTVLSTIPAGLTQGQRVIFDSTYTTSFEIETTGLSTLVYNRVVQYIGEISGVNNVQEANQSYSQVYAHIPDHVGKTPDVLFRTSYDDNFKPNLEFPILPSEYQPEIKGGEQFSSPIVNDPTNYPGTQYGHFDTTDYTYKTSSGDSQRRTGDYYGVFGDINTKTFDGRNIDGVGVDFDQNHYVKMNIINQEAANFDEFNSMPINGEAPKDYEFNAILWYYTVTDASGESATNLYGITFLDNPSNDPNDLLKNIHFPTYKKFVTDGTKDGNSYDFALNLNFNIINENLQLQYNPNTVYGLFSFNLFNDAMSKLGLAGDLFLNYLGQTTALQQELDNVKQLIYSQTDLALINKKLANLENLLTMYKSLQLSDSDTIKVNINNSTSPPLITLDSIDQTYHSIFSTNTSDLYNISGVIPFNISVPQNKNFLIKVNNNDETNITLPNNDNLTIVLDKDLVYKQSFDFYINANSSATQNKKVNLYMVYDNGNINNVAVTTEFITNIDLPIYYNSNSQTASIAKTWKQQTFNIPLGTTNSIKLNTGNTLTLPLDSTIGIKKGDIFNLNNFYMGSTNSVNYSGQYKVDFIGTASTYVDLDVSTNVSLVSFANTQTLPYIVHSSTYSVLNSIPYLNFNKGVKYKITRVDQTTTGTITDRYLIEKEYLD